MVANAMIFIVDAVRRDAVVRGRGLATEAVETKATPRFPGCGDEGAHTGRQERSRELVRRGTPTRRHGEWGRSEPATN